MYVHEFVTGATFYVFFMSEYDELDGSSVNPPSLGSINDAYRFWQKIQWNLILTVKSGTKATQLSPLQFLWRSDHLHPTSSHGESVSAFHEFVCKPSRFLSGNRYEIGTEIVLGSNVIESNQTARESMETLAQEYGKDIPG